MFAHTKSNCYKLLDNEHNIPLLFTWYIVCIYAKCIAQEDDMNKIMSIYYPAHAFVGDLETETKTTSSIQIWK